MDQEDDRSGLDPRGVPSGAIPRVPPPRSSRGGHRPGPSLAQRLLRAILGMVLVGLLMLLTVFAVGWFWMGPALDVEQGTWIEVRFDAEYPEERRDPRGWRGAFEPPVLSAQELAAGLRRAAIDPRVEGVVLHADGFAGGWAQAHELRERLLDLRARDKRVVAWAAAPASIDYFVASAAERIFIAPEGMIWIGGLQAQLVFLRDALQKVGVGFEAISVGEYKSAPETFTEDGSSEASRQQIMDYLDDVFDVFAVAVAEGRAITPERTRSLVDRAIFDAEQAIAEGLADEIGDLESLFAVLGPAPRLDVLDYLDAAGEGLGRGSVPEIALVHVTGTIVGGRSGSDGLAGDFAGHETVTERLRQASDDDAIRAVVLRIDSPGGSALASDLILQELRRVRARKPVVVSMAETAASGGYYVAMEADEVWADPLSLTGSIGVFLLKPNLSGAYEKLGLRLEAYRRGENANLFDTGRAFDPVQRERLQEQLDRFYARFVQKVAEGRGLDLASAEEAARGRVWSGRRAQEIGLVDALGGVEAAVAAAARLGGIDEKVRPRLVTFQPEAGFLDALIESLFADDVRVDGLRLETWVERAGFLGPLRTLEGFVAAADGTAQFLLPWRLRVR